MNYAELLRKKFSGCPVAATMQDINRERTVKIYYIGEVTLKDVSAHVGLNDGVDVWISPVKGCFQSLPAGFLEQQLVLAAEGKIAPEAVRKTINKFTVTGRFPSQPEMQSLPDKKIMTRRPTNANA